MTCIQTLVILSSITQKKRSQCQEKWLPESLRSQEALERAVDSGHGGLFPSFSAVGSHALSAEHLQVMLPG